MTKKTCPYCGNPLEEGTFQSRGGNHFLPAGAKNPKLYTKSSMEKKRAILLPPDFLSLVPQWPQAYVCRNCKIIIPYE